MLNKRYARAVGQVEIHNAQIDVAPGVEQLHGVVHGCAQKHIAHTGCALQAHLKPLEQYGVVVADEYGVLFRHDMADNFLKLQNYTFAFVCTSLKIMICTTARAVRGIFVSPNVAIGAQNERIGGGNFIIFNDKNYKQELYICNRNLTKYIGGVSE